MVHIIPSSSRGSVTSPLMVRQAYPERAVHPSRASGRTASRRAHHERTTAVRNHDLAVRPKPVEGQAANYERLQARAGGRRLWTTKLNIAIKSIIV